MWSVGCIFVDIAVQCHLGRAAADAGEGEASAAAVPGKDLLPAQRAAVREGADRAVRRGDPRGDASVNEDLRGDRHAAARRPGESG